MMRRGDEYLVQPVWKALRVLEYAVRHGCRPSLTDAVRELSLPKTTVFRYLRTLSAAGFLEHDIARDRYAVGDVFREIARLDQQRQQLRAAALPEMRALVEAFHETVNLAVISDSEVMYIDLMQPDRRALKSQVQVGERHPVHSTALGKAMMAFMPEARSPLSFSGELPPMTCRTLTDADALRRQLSNARRLGYAIEVGENEDGMMCIGAPVLDSTGTALAAMSLSAPARRMPRERTEGAARALRTAVERVSLTLCRETATRGAEPPLSHFPLDETRLG